VKRTQFSTHTRESKGTGTRVEHTSNEHPRHPAQAGKGLWWGGDTQQPVGCWWCCWQTRRRESHGAKSDTNTWSTHTINDPTALAAQRTPDCSHTQDSSRRSMPPQDHGVGSKKDMPRGTECVRRARGLRTSRRPATMTIRSTLTTASARCAAHCIGAHLVYWSWCESNESSSGTFTVRLKGSSSISRLTIVNFRGFSLPGFT
jgi:hypothetical protein